MRERDSIDRQRETYKNVIIFLVKDKGRLENFETDFELHTFLFVNQNKNKIPIKHEERERERQTEVYKADFKILPISPRKPNENKDRKTDRMTDREQHNFFLLKTRGVQI